MELLAEVISVSLGERLEEGQRYRVHSRFSHGINIEAKGRLAFIGNKENEILPYGILIPSRQLKVLHQLFQGEEVLWRGKSFVTDRGCLGTNQARDFMDALPVSLSSKAPVWIPDFGEYEGLQTGFGESIGDAKALSGEKNKSLGNAIRDGNALEEVLGKWIGAGPGLTPSGDDYLTGILAADRMYHFSCRGFKETIVKLLSRGYTTDIGANQLICAAEGRFSGSWIGFIEAYNKKNNEKMKRYLTGILKYGHTSGRDMFAGFLMGLGMANCGV